MKSFLGNFYRLLAIFSGHTDHCPALIRVRLSSSKQANDTNLLDLLDKMTPFGELVFVSPKNLLACLANRLKLFGRPLLDAHQSGEIVLNLFLGQVTSGRKRCKIRLTCRMVSQVGLERFRRGWLLLVSPLNLVNEFTVCGCVCDEATE